MRASALLESDPQAAARGASAILKAYPDHEEARLLLATASQRLGDGATARSQLESLLSATPRSPTLQLELARAHAAAGRHTESVAALEAALALDERFADGWRELAAQRYLSGDEGGGDAAYAQYMRLASAPAELADANFAIAQRRFDTAEAILLAHLRKSPGDAVALHMLATIATARGNHFEAEKLLTDCLQRAPGYAAARFDLASELYAQQRHTELLPMVERLLTTYPDEPSYIGLKAQALRLYGQVTEALALMSQTIAAHPKDAKLLLLYGHLLRESGEQAAAIEAYRQALALQPAMGEAYWSLADLKTVVFSDDERAQMEQQLVRCPPFGARRTSLEFALGKAFEDAGLYAPSFEHYAKGNALYRSTVYYDASVMSLIVQRSKALYTPRFFSERSQFGTRRADPIFIVGMPRSGSTLLEQILASHSQVEGTRELPEVPAIARKLVYEGLAARAEPDYPGPLAKLDKADFEAYAQRYLRNTALHRPLSRPRFVDKMLGNFAHLGLIHLMFPNATVIDARRHPLACTFSCYKQLFPRGLAFTYDQQELGRYYRDYVELMEHIDAVLPGRVHRVHYEELVADAEGVVRRLLAHCGLPFEEGCLRFYENRRVVNTVSSEQVRRPISAGAVAHWRHYEPWLGELGKQLGDLIDRYPNFVAQPGISAAP